MLPRSQRLVAAADHRLVARRGRRVRRGSLVVKCVLNGSASVGMPRVAVVVPKTLGSAPVRNRLRRRLQNLVAERIAGLPGGSLTVVRAEPGALSVDRIELSEALSAALNGAASSAAPTKAVQQ